MKSDVRDAVIAVLLTGQVSLLATTRFLLEENYPPESPEYERVKTILRSINAVIANSMFFKPEDLMEKDD